MSTDPLTANALGAVVNDLTSRLGDRVVGPQDARWDEARRAWNLSVDQHPVAVAMPESSEDVVAVMTDKYVIAVAPMELIVADPALQRVIATAALKNVVANIAAKYVFAVTSKELIVA